MTQEISKPNIFVTLLIAVLIYNISLKTCDYFKIFKLKETVAARSPSDKAQIHV